MKCFKQKWKVPLNNEGLLEAVMEGCKLWAKNFPKQIISSYLKKIKLTIRQTTLNRPYLVKLFGFYCISTFAGYLMPNPFLYKQSVLFQAIQLSMNTQFNCQKHFYIKVFSLVKQF